MKSVQSRFLMGLESRLPLKANIILEQLLTLDTWLKNTLYMSRKVEEWTKEIKHLAKVAVSQPHAAYAAFTHQVDGHV